MCQPFDGYESYADELCSCVLEDVDMHYVGGVSVTNCISGSIDLPEERLLVFAIPYSRGWSLQVDGESRVLDRANIAFMGAVLEPGHHEVVLTYRTPGLRLGFTISLVGLALAAVWGVAERLARRANRG